MDVPLTRPALDASEEQEIVDALRSGWVSQGPKVRAFEEGVAAYTGAKHAVATNSCTAALHISMILAGIGPGDEVICPSYSYIATANSIRYTGARPVFADIDRSTFNLDPTSVEKAITARTRAILVVHQIGLSADLGAMSSIAAHSGLQIIEDAAPSLGATYRGTQVGATGRFVCLSFHPRKVITTGEGGMLLTDDADVAAQARILRSHGASVSDLDRFAAKGTTQERYVALGYNYRMSDLHAAVGLHQLRKLDSFLAERRRIAARYDAGLAGSGIITPAESEDCRHSWQSYSVLLSDAIRASTSDVVAALAERDISSRRGIASAHLEPTYAADHPGLHLPESEHCSERAMMLPIYPEMTEAEQDHVIRTLLEATG